MPEGIDKGELRRVWAEADLQCPLILGCPAWESLPDAVRGAGCGRPHQTAAMLPSDARDGRSTASSDELLSRGCGLRRPYVFLPKAQFFLNGSDEMADVDTCVRGEEPQVVEVARLVASPILESYDLFRGDFGCRLYTESGRSSGMSSNSAIRA